MGLYFLRLIKKAFKQDHYFNIVSLYSYFNEPTFSFLRWLNYFKFSMDLLIWHVYSATQTRIGSRELLQREIRNRRSETFRAAIADFAGLGISDHRRR